MNPITGRCLCGQITFQFESFAGGVAHCHCSMCRQWGGGPLLAVECGTEVQFEGEESIAHYESSAWASRGFCKHCGTHLFYQLKDGGDYIMPVGLFADDTGFDFTQQIFIDEKPEYYCFANKTSTMTAAEVFAKYMPSE